MASPRVKYFAIHRPIDNMLLATESSDKKNKDAFTTEFKTLIKRIEEVDLQPEERQKVRSQNGAWFVTCDNKKIYYAVLAENEYPERHAYALVTEVISKLATLSDYHMESDLGVQNHTKRYLPGLLEKYSDLSKVDKLYQAKESVSQIQSIMAENISKASANRESLIGIEDRSQRFKSLASNFYENSEELATLAARNKRNMYLVAGAVTSVVVGVILINFV